MGLAERKPPTDRTGLVKRAGSPGKDLLGPAKRKRKRGRLSAGTVELEIND